MTKQYQRGTAAVRPTARRAIRRHPVVRAAVSRALPVTAAVPLGMNTPEAEAPPSGAPPPGMIPGGVPGYKKGTASVKHKGHEKLHDNRHVAAAGHFPVQAHAKLHMSRHVTQTKGAK